MDLSTEELLALLSDQTRAEMARLEAEQTRAREFTWILHQIEYLQQVIREGFEDISTRISELEDIVLSSDHRRASLRRQLVVNLKTLSAFQEERALRADEINVALDNRIETLRTQIDQIKQELDCEGTSET